MNTYARLQNGVVAELLTTAISPAQLFNPGLHWSPVVEPGVQPGWLANTSAASGITTFAAPLPVTPSLPAPPSIAQLQAELATLTAQIAVLAATLKAGG